MLDSDVDNWHRFIEATAEAALKPVENKLELFDKLEPSERSRIYILIWALKEVRNAVAYIYSGLPLQRTDLAHKGVAFNIIESDEEEEEEEEPYFYPEEETESGDEDDNYYF